MMVSVTERNQGEYWDTQGRSALVRSDIGSQFLVGVNVSLFGGIAGVIARA